MNTLRLLSEFHAGSLTLADTWRGMLAPATLETVLELAAEAGRLGDAARTKLGVGGDVASTTATTFEMADAAHLDGVLRAVRAVPGVFDAYRVTA